MYPQRSVMTCGLATALEPPHFNHAPVRGAIGASFSRRSRAGSFNPRTRVGCDQSLVLYHRAAREFQSTHPRGVRRDGSITGRRRVLVSIHAPAWGATSPWGKDYFTTASVSIHAPAWGATRSSSANASRWPGFNPRTRVGCDQLCAAGQRHRWAGFNPRTRVGCDAPLLMTRSLATSFNPRTRVGCDLLSGCGTIWASGVSIHAPAWGAT